MSLSAFFPLVLLLSTLVQAHIQLSYPLPLRSPLDDTVPWDVKDYSYTNPLLGKGGPYPCKGYIGSPEFRPRDDLRAGQTVHVTTAGTATHNGGCELFLLTLERPRVTAKTQSAASSLPSERDSLSTPARFPS